MAIWDRILNFWATGYTGFRLKFVAHQGSLFQKSFAELSAPLDVKVFKKGVQSHNSLGVGERYHGPPRYKYLKLRDEHPSVDQKAYSGFSCQSNQRYTRS